MRRRHTTTLVYVTSMLIASMLGYMLYRINHVTLSTSLLTYILFAGCMQYTWSLMRTRTDLVTLHQTVQFLVHFNDVSLFVPTHTRKTSVLRLCVSSADESVVIARQTSRNNIVRIYILNSHGHTRKTLRLADTNYVVTPSIPERSTLGLSDRLWLSLPMRGHEVRELAAIVDHDKQRQRRLSPTRLAA